MVRALASQQCGPGLIPELGVLCGLSLLLVLVLAPRGFHPLLLRFSPLLKNQHFQISIRSESEGHRVASRTTPLSNEHVNDHRSYISNVNSYENKS